MISQEIKLQPEREAILKQGLVEGMEFYHEYNEARLDLAFESFDPEMRMALFELIYLLHTNGPSLSEVAYLGTYLDTTTDDSNGTSRQVEGKRMMNLYVEGAPHGIKGLQTFSPVFNEDFRKYVSNEFGGPLSNVPDAQCPIVCLQSIGSIGTISHKSGSSDLDLQVIYNFNPSGREAANWDDNAFREALKGEQSWWERKLGREKKLSPEQLRDGEIAKLLNAKASQQVAKAYPGLHKYVVAGNGNLATDLNGPKGQAVRLGLINELMLLAQRHFRRGGATDNKKREALLNERIELIQQYISEKYPRAEIYMFACSLDMYRAGRYTSSLDFKESSGSAYELILNYETLMPGIQFTPAVPSHFVFPQLINNDPAFYQRLARYIQFDLIALYGGHSDRLVGKKAGAGEKAFPGATAGWGNRKAAECQGQPTGGQSLSRIAQIRGGRQR